MSPRSKQENVRGRSLRIAGELVNGDRNVDYGDPRADFQRTATYWSTHATGVFDRKCAEAGIEVPPEIREIMLTLIDTWDVAIMMGQLKDSRLAWSPRKADHWVDKEGYAACGAHCADGEGGELTGWPSP